MIKICEQTTVAEIDDSAAICDPNPISTTCVIHEAAISYLGLPTNSNMTEVVNALLLSLIDARNRILTLET